LALKYALSADLKPNKAILKKVLYIVVFLIKTINRVLEKTECLTVANIDRFVGTMCS